MRMECNNVKKKNPLWYFKEEKNIFSGYTQHVFSFSLDTLKKKKKNKKYNFEKQELTLNS